MPKPFVPGDTVPWFRASALDGNPSYAFDTTAGRFVVMLFLGPDGPASRDALGRLDAGRRLFDDEHACFFGVSTNPDDVSSRRIAQQLPGVRWFLDFDRSLSKRYGAVQDDGGSPVDVPHWLLLDRRLRVVETAPLDRGDAILAVLAQLLRAGVDDDMAAPVLVVPRVIDPDLCRELIARYDRHGGEESGFMGDEGGRTVLKLDPAHKRRADWTVDDDALRESLRARIGRFLRPQIRHAFQFDVSRIERWLVACYDSEGGGGHFRAHRDNTTKGTAHRKFACTINLNAGDYDGGDLRFPEFGRRTYRAPTGGAVIFSCSLLHEVEPVRRGKRYAFLPFLYDDEGARVRERNLAFLPPEHGGYTAGLPPPPPVPPPTG